MGQIYNKDEKPTIDTYLNNPFENGFQETKYFDINVSNCYW
jgi:hypothetical protein